MTNDRTRWMARTRLIGAAAFVAGLAIAASAQAQPSTPASRADASVAAPSQPPKAEPSFPGVDPLEGVTVNGSRPEPKAAIPADKRAAYDAAVAKEAAFREYRRSTPKLSGDDKGVGNSNDMSKDFPGLQSYVPPN